MIVSYFVRPNAKLEAEITKKKHQSKEKKPADKERLRKKAKERYEKQKALREDRKRAHYDRYEFIEMAKEQRRNPLCPFKPIIESEAFRERYKLMVGKYFSYDDIPAAQLPDYMLFIQKCFELLRKHKEDFKFIMAWSQYSLNFTFNKIPIKHFLEELEADVIDKKHLLEYKLSFLPGSERRRIIQALATPKWRDRLAIKDIYSKRDEMNKTSREKYHVDHIIPIQGEFVCGLHVHQNLEVIPATENIKKNNAYMLDA